MYVLNFLQNLVLIIIQRASVVFMNALLNDNHDLWLPPAYLRRKDPLSYVMIVITIMMNSPENKSTSRWSAVQCYINGTILMEKYF